MGRKEERRDKDLHKSSRKRKTGAITKSPKKPVRKLSLKRVDLTDDIDFHPIKKKKTPRRNATQPAFSTSLLDPQLDRSFSDPGPGLNNAAESSYSLSGLTFDQSASMENGDPSQSSSRESAGGDSASSSKGKAFPELEGVAVEAQSEFESPRKVARLPFMGVQATVTGVSEFMVPSSQPGSEICFRSPDTAMMRPLKRSISGNCIRQLAEMVVSPEKASDEAALEEEEEEEMPAFPDETGKLRSKKPEGNFIKIDIRKKSYTRMPGQQGNKFKKMKWMQFKNRKY